MNLEEYGYRKDFDFDNRFDLKTQVGKYTISTIDLGIDHSFGFGEPLYYETMIFNFEKSGFEDLYCKRYATEEEAREGHQEAIDYVKENL